MILQGKLPLEGKLPRQIIIGNIKSSFKKTVSEAYGEPCQTSRMNPLAKKVRVLKCIRAFWDVIY